MVMGPGDHGGLGGGVDMADLAERWFSHYLLGRDTGILSEPNVRYFVMEGEQEHGEWSSDSNWPPAVTTWTLPLLDDGGLGTPSNAPSPVTIEHDPDIPETTSGGRNLFLESGALQQDASPSNPARLVFQSEALVEPVEIVGEVLLDLKGVLEQSDGHWVAFLLDISPDGQSHRLVTEGSLRAALRKGTENPLPVPEGEAVLYEISVYSTAWRFAAGHRIGLALAASNSPRLAVYPEAQKQEVIVNGPSVLRLPVR